MKRTIAVVLLIAMAMAVPALAASSQAAQVVAVAMKRVGASYALNSNPPKTFNCFSFVEYCVNQVVPDKITAMGIDGGYTKVKSIQKLKVGDIVCFKSSSRLKGVLGYHYGIYAGKGYFIHAANKSDGVIVSKVKDYKKRFVGAIRVF